MAEIAHRNTSRFFGCVVALAVTAFLAAAGVAAVGTAVADSALSAAETNPTASSAWVRESLQPALRFRPDRSEAWRVAADSETQSDPQSAKQLQLHALRLDPTDWQNWLELGMIDFQLGNSQAAEKETLRATQYSNGFRAHYAIANLAFLLGDTALFWHQMQMVLAIAPADQIPSILQDIVRLGGGQVPQLMAILPPGRAEVSAATIGFLAQALQLPAADAVWRQLRCPAYQRAACQQAALDLANAWLEAAVSAGTSPSQVSHDPNPALRAQQVWNTAVQRRIIIGDAVQTGRVSDSGFEYDWQDFGFGWHAANSQLQRSRSSSSGAPNKLSNTVLVPLNGYQPGYELLLWQWVVVRPGARYQIAFRVRGQDMENPRGFQAEICTPGGAVLQTVGADPGSDWTAPRGSFRAPDGASLLRLNFVYRRPLGEPLSSGEVELRDVTMHELGSAQ